MVKLLESHYFIARLQHLSTNQLVLNLRDLTAHLITILPHVIMLQNTHGISGILGITLAVILVYILGPRGSTKFKGYFAWNYLNYMLN